MANFDNFRQLDFQETGSAADSDSILIIRLDSSGKITSALNYKISTLKAFLTADTQSKLEQMEAIQSDVNSTRTEVIGIRDTMEERITAIVGSAVTNVVYIDGEQYVETSRFSDKGEPFTEYVKVVGE